MAGIVGGILPRWVAGYGVVRVALAVILLTAAGLKCHQLATEPTLGTGLLESRWFLMATVEFELFFGLWLLSGLLPRLTWTAALGCFGLFACVSLYKALSGAASCGCFGRVEVNPWYTFTLDVTCVLALLRWRPSGVAIIPSRAFLLRGAVVMVAWLSVGVPAAWAMGTYQPSLLGVDGVIVGDDDLVILEPEKWVGARFPLLGYISIGPEFEGGRWFVLLYHNNCSECQKAITDLPQITRRLNVERVALIEAPPYSNNKGLSLSGIKVFHGHLDDTKEWFVSSPVGLLLNEGVVSDVCQGYATVRVKREAVRQ